MAHFTLTNGVGWSAADPVTAAQWASLDAKVFAGINGDLGGTYAPTSTIQLDSTNGGSFKLTGPLVLDGGAASVPTTLTLLSGAAITLDSGDFPKLAAGHKDSTRTRIVPLMFGEANPKYGARADVPSGSLQIVATSFYADITGVTTPTSWHCPLRVANGSTLSTVAIAWIPVMGNPRMRLERVTTGGQATPITLQAPGADANGYVTVVPPKGLLAGTKIVTTLPVDPGVVIDISQYTYFLRVIEDQTLKTVFPNQIVVKQTVDLASTGSNVTTTGSQTIDGVTPATGKRVLLKDQSPNSNNGIWIVNTSGAWTYAPDAGVGGVPGVQGVQYLPGMIVFVKFGQQNQGSVWQLQNEVQYLNLSPQTWATIPVPMPPNSTTPIATAAVGNGFFAIGNQYFTAAVTCNGITDDRWQ